VHVLVYEQQHTGHFYQCVQPLLGPLAAIASRLTLAVTEQGPGSAEFREHLAPTLAALGGAVRVETRIALPRPGMRWADRPRELRILRSVLADLRPDYLLVPTGDVLTSAHALYTLSGRRALPRGVRGEAIMHTGPGAAVSARHRAKRAVFSATHALSAWDRVHFINQLACELERRNPLLGSRAVALPYPIWPAPGVSKAEARARLGLPEDGALVVATGFLDGRKAVGELMDAFAGASREPTDRLLLAGPLDAPYAHQLETRHAALLRSGHIVATRRYHQRDEFDAALAAADVVAAPYPGFDGLSSVVLSAVSAGRPVLTDRHGWSGEMNRRYGLGWTADTRSTPELSATLARALREAPAYTQNARTRRMIEWHRPENYAATFLQRVRALAGAPPDPPIPWESVAAAGP
jgi:glycosyltransferase involved in cell wall biosynthesis